MESSARFIPARSLANQLATELEPRLRVLLPGVPLALAFIGSGSDVMGCDTARSMDHDWGPRLTIVVPKWSVEEISGQIDAAINDLLPANVAGFPTRFSRHEDGTLFPNPHGLIHRLGVTSLDDLVELTVGVGTVGELTTAHWLSTPMQSFLEFTAGDVFVDDTGDLTRVKGCFAFYPDAVWRYQLAALWMRVSQVQPFIGRAGEVEDGVGSAVITAGVSRDLMRIALLQVQNYVPYAKWLGTICSRTRIGAAVLPELNSALAATDWREREDGINSAGLRLIEQLNTLGLIEPVAARAEQFHSRPFTILPAEKIAHALSESLSGTDCEHLPHFVGGIDIVTDSTDAVKNREFQSAFRSMLTRS